MVMSQLEEKMVSIPLVKLPSGGVDQETAKQQTMTCMKGEARPEGGWVRVPAQLNHSQYQKPDLHWVWGSPGQVVQRVIVPDIELVVETPGKHHADEVTHEEGQD